MKKISWLSGLLLVGLGLCFSACDKTNMVLIRVENGTGYDITEVFVSGPEDDHQYGDLKVGEKSDYKTYEEAYRYAFCTFNIDTSQFTIQPIDFVGESLLKPGKYAYRLTISDLNSPWASMELTE